MSPHRLITRPEPKDSPFQSVVVFVATIVFGGVIGVAAFFVLSLRAMTEGWPFDTLLQSKQDLINAVVVGGLLGALLGLRFLFQGIASARRARNDSDPHA